MIEIVYETECHCGETATSTTLDLSQPEADGRIHIDIDMSVGQIVLTCNACGCEYSTGDIDWYAPGEDDCPGDEDDDEDEDDPAVTR